MGTLNDIIQKLQSGYTVSQLIGEGYAKSSVNHAARNLKSPQPATISSPSVDGELQELRHQKEVIKLQKEIAELESAMEKLPDRVAALEKRVIHLQSLLYNAVDTAIMVCMEYAGMDREEAKKYADGWVERNIKGE
ncbi:hypothetical protein ACFLYL_03105 [Chloroflexota bacterium]